MKVLVCLSLLTGSTALGDEVVDRAAIDRIVGTLNTAFASSDTRMARTVLAAGSESELESFAGDRRPWSEVTPPRLKVDSVRFVNGDLAIVDASSTQFGSIIMMRRVPVLLVVKRQRGEWKVASLRLLPIALTRHLVPVNWHQH